jgi:hypothetical protein
MIHPRRFTRTRPASQLFKTGQIIVSPRDPAIDCTIVDYGAGGASLELSHPAVLPSQFELRWASTSKTCRLIWKAGKRAGVTF